jgi:hypothetical protein
MYNARYSCQILTKLEHTRQIFEKYSNINFHRNPSRGNRVSPCGGTDTQTDGQTDGQTDRHDEVNRRFLQLREVA